MLSSIQIVITFICFAVFNNIFAVDDTSEVKAMTLSFEIAGFSFPIYYYKISLYDIAGPSRWKSMIVFSCKLKKKRHNLCCAQPTVPNDAFPIHDWNQSKYKYKLMGPGDKIEFLFSIVEC